MTGIAAPPEGEGPGIGRRELGAPTDPVALGIQAQHMDVLAVAAVAHVTRLGPGDRTG